jgi:ubiquinone/menaquinone biosynthesis C-methylase UbiE
LRGDYQRFFHEYDVFRYHREPHILRALNRFKSEGKRVREIGIGQGADAEQLIQRGARWSGLDLTQESVDRMRMRTKIHELPIEDIKVGSALEIPYADRQFDVVFSHGVLHHIPEIRRAQAEIRRVLKSTGSLIIMVYAKHSLNYQVSIRVIRRLGLALLMPVPRKLPGIYERHRENARTVGLANYLRLHNFVHRSADGPVQRSIQFGNWSGTSRPSESRRPLSFGCIRHRCRREAFPASACSVGICGPASNRSRFDCRTRIHGLKRTLRPRHARLRNFSRPRGPPPSAGAEAADSLGRLRRDYSALPNWHGL